MPILFSDEQGQFADESRRLLDASYDPAALKLLLEQRGAFDARFWAASGEMGWTAIAVSEAHGGLGLGLVDLCLVTEAMGRVTAGAPFVSTGYGAACAIGLCGDDALGAEFLPGLAAGTSIGVLATGEAAGILPAHPAVSLRGGRVTGTKTAVVGGAVADIALVLASGEDGGSALCLVDLSAPGVTRTPLETIDNSRNLADLTFDGAGCRVLPGDGMALARAAVSRVIVAVASEQVGGADACLEAARDWANERVAFGQKIGRFQAVKHSLAEMYVLIEIARAATLDAAIRIDRGEAGAGLHAAAARLAATKAYEYAARQAIQVHGGIGVTWEANLHLHYRRSRALATEWGAPFFWEDVLVDELGATT